jgi:hypothetical protein
MASLTRDTRSFWLVAPPIALVLGLAAAHRVILEPGVVGLYHDWTIPPAGAQVTAYAQQLFDGWQARGLGAPLDYPTEYPYWFVLALAVALSGIQGAALSKVVVVIVPALAFLSAAALARALRRSAGASAACGITYALCPVILNKMVAGQLTYLFAYALLPLVLALTANALRSRRPTAGGLAAGALVAIVFMQIQLGVLAGAAVVLATALCARAGPLERLRFLGAASLALGLGLSPTILALVLNHAATAAAKSEPVLNSMEWLRFNSAPPLEALKLIGYATHYDLTALSGWYPVWSAAAYVVAAAAIAGLATAPAAVRWFSAILGLCTLVAVTGVYSPFAAAIAWAFAHVSLAQVFRELYHLMAGLALVYAVGIAYFWDSRIVGSVRFAKWIAVASLCVFVAPVLSGDCAGQLQAHPYDTELANAYRLLANADRRVAWFPIDQPLEFLGSGAGVDPMATTRPGSLWAYTLSWPLTAVDMYARASRWPIATRGLEMLSVGTVVDRRDFASKLWQYEKGDAPRHYYLERPLSVPALSPNPTVVFPFDRIYRIAGRPMAYGAEAVAFVPARLEVIGSMAGGELVPIPFGADIPDGLPYVVVRDAADAADEALTGGGLDLPLEAQSIYADTGFASLSAWWFFTPSFGEGTGGVVTFGPHHLDVPVGRALRDGVVEVSWIGTPIGGRVRIGAGDRSVVIDTQSTPAVWRSTWFRAGPLRSNGVVSIDALDPGAAVALRAVRALEAARFADAQASYTRRLRAARAVVDWRIGPQGVYRRERQGTSAQLGSFAFGSDYRIRVRYRVTADDDLFVLDPKGNLVGFARLPRAGREARSEFEGIDAQLHVATATGSPIDGWSIETRSAASPAAAYSQVMRLSARGVTPGTFDGSAATVPEPGRVAVLNVAYGPNWLASAPGSHHLPTALGTNAWLLPARTPAMTIVNSQKRAFHAVFTLGSATLVAGLLAPLFLGVRRRLRFAWRG